MNSASPPPLLTTHRFLVADARALEALPCSRAALVLTSPPYPMIEMWDETFRRLSAEAAAALDAGDGWAAFEAMHRELDRAWRGCREALVEGGLCVVNVGDAVRTLGDSFALYPNHARIVTAMRALGFTPLPDILWRKPANSPTKFLGSGMLPPGAYVTYEHEYVLIFRKGGKRPFSDPEARAWRRRSAFFWEERNVWFSDLWEDLTGARQDLADGSRTRSGAFPFELAYRLVNMFSVLGDTVLDPFAGTGTTAAAAVAAGRGSVSVEIDPALLPLWEEALRQGLALGRARARARLQAHRDFVRRREKERRPLRHRNAFHRLPVVTAQETELCLYEPVRILRRGRGLIEVEHHPARAQDAERPLFA